MLRVGQSVARARTICTESVVSLAALGNAKLEAGKFSEASEHYGRALARCRAASAIDTVVLSNNLAHALSRQGEYAAAVPLFEVTHLRAESLLALPDCGTDLAQSELMGALTGLAGEPRQFLNTVRLGALDNLSIVLTNTDPVRAREMSERALREYDRLLGADHSDTLASANNLGCLLRDQGALDEARAVLSRAHKGLAALGREEPRALSVLDNLAGVVGRQGEYAEAQQMHAEALAGREKVLGPDHPSTLESVNHLACVLAMQRQYTEAEPAFERALAGQRVGLGDDNPLVLQTIKQLALTKVQLVKLGEAADLFEQLRGGYARTLGDDHPMTLEVGKSCDALRSTDLRDETRLREQVREKLHTKRDQP